MGKEFVIQPYKGKFSSILIFGPPGSGKGTLGKFLAHAGTQYHLSSSDIFRNLPTTSAAGKLYYSYASKGLLLPDDATLDIWQYYVQGLIATNSFYPESQDLLLDGIPRTLVQAQMLQDYITVRHIIIIDIANPRELLERMQKKARQQGRIEDYSLDVLKRRLDIYEKEIEMMANFYPHHLISRVNGDQKPLEVLRDVLVRLSHVLSHGPNSVSHKCSS